MVGAASVRGGAVIVLISIMTHLDGRRAFTLVVAIAVVVEGCGSADSMTSEPTPEVHSLPLECQSLPGIEDIRWSPFDPVVGVAKGLSTTGLYVTHDGGQSWTRVPYDWSDELPDAASGFAPSAVVFLDADHWIITGAITRGDRATLDIASRVVGTRDGGHTFEPIFEGSDDTRFLAYPTDAAIKPFGASAEAVFRLDEQRLVALARGLLFGSVDGGATFTRTSRFSTWATEGTVPGLPSVEIVRWAGERDDGTGLAVLTPVGIGFTRDGGVTFEIIAEGFVHRAWLDPLGRAIVLGAGSSAIGLSLYERRDGQWSRVRRIQTGGRDLSEILHFEPDGSFLARLDDRDGAPSPSLTRFVERGDDYVLQDVVVDAGDGLTLGFEQVWSAGAQTRVLARGSGTTVYRRFLCESGPGVTPSPLPLAGVPDDLAPGEMAVVAHRGYSSAAWDRMAFDAKGHVYVASSRGLWAGPPGSRPILDASGRGTEDWRPFPGQESFPEVSGVAVLPDGSVAFGLNYFGTGGGRRILEIDPVSGAVARWRAFQPFEEGDDKIIGIGVLAGRLFASTAIGTAAIDAGRDTGPGQRYHGLPGRGVAREDGAWFHLPSRTPSAGLHTIGRTSIFSGELPRGECVDCPAYPGLIQALAVDDRDNVYVLDRRLGQVWMRAYEADGATWQLVASGFHNPADLVSRTDARGLYLAVLDGDIWAFRPDPAHVAVRGLRMRAGGGEAAPAVPTTRVEGSTCSPCITPPTYPGRPDEIEALGGTLLLEPNEEGRFCLEGVGFGEAQGSVWFGEVPVSQLTRWADDTVCGRVELDGLFDGLVVVETAEGSRSNGIPYVAPVRSVRFPQRGDRPLMTGDVVSIEGENLGTLGHSVVGAVALGVQGDSLRVLLDAAFGGRLLFRKLPSTEIWTKDVTVFPSELLGGVAGPNELGGVSGHVGAGAITWTLDGEPLVGGPTGRWFDDVTPVGEHRLVASFAGRELEVLVPRVAWDTHHLGPLHPDGIGLPRHRQGVAHLGGQAYALVRTSGWLRPGGPTGQLVPGVPEIVAVASTLRRDATGPFTPGQAMDRAARFGLPDRNYDASDDLPRLIEGADGLWSVARAMDVTIELDNEGVPTVTDVRRVVPMKARVSVHPRGTLGAMALGDVTIPNGAADGRMTGAGHAGGVFWVAMHGDGETWFAGGPAATPEGWGALGKIDGAWEAHPVGEGAVVLQTGEGAAAAMRRASFIADETTGAPRLVVGEPIDLTLEGSAATRIMAWRAEGDGTLLLALRHADRSERIAALAPGRDSLEGLAVVPAGWPGVGATYDADGQAARYGVADVVRHRGALHVALAGGTGQAAKGLWVARLADGAMTREMASVEVDTVRCLGPYAPTPGSCGTTGVVETNTSGCTYFACPMLTRLWLPQQGGEVEHARLAVDDDGLQVTYSVKFPEGWSRDTLDRGRIRTAVFSAEPFGD